MFSSVWVLEVSYHFQRKYSQMSKAVFKCLLSVFVFIFLSFFSFSFISFFVLFSFFFLVFSHSTLFSQMHLNVFYIGKFSAFALMLFNT